MTMSQALAEKILLAPADLDTSHLDRIMGEILRHPVDDADLYFQHTYVESWVLEDGRVKEGSYHIHNGVGVRAVVAEKTGFAHTDEVNYPKLKKLAGFAREIAMTGGRLPVAATPPLRVYPSDLMKTPLYSALNPLESLDSSAKIALLQSVDQKARSIDPRVLDVHASLAAKYEVVLICNSSGVLSFDFRPMVRLSVNVIVEEKGRRESGTAGGGGRSDYLYFLENNRGLSFVEKAVHEALTNLKAIDAPAGTMPVVLGPGWPGVLLHEAVGHGLEGDFNRRGVSAFSGRIGERVAAPHVTVVDNGTLVGRRGSLHIDDEGTPTQCTTLIENGILKGYMQDRQNARLMGVLPTGNCRRESYAHVPMPRMTNTYMLAGNLAPEEIIASVEKGLYAVNFSGGQVDITSGKFVFTASEAYLIEHGKITKPVKGATLIGSGPEVMQKISMIATDLELDPGVGTCGKEGQSVPVGVGLPTIKIDALTVGGTAH